MNLFHKASAIVVGLGVLGAAAPVLANPDIATSVRSGKVSSQVCMSGAKSGAQKLKLENFKADSGSISGDYKEYSILVLCSSPKSAPGLTIQTIVVAGPAGSKTEEVREQLKRAIDE